LQIANISGVHAARGYASFLNLQWLMANGQFARLITIAFAAAKDFAMPATASPDHQAAYDSLCAHARETALLTSIRGLLEWDERTKMPLAAGAYRAEQLAYLAGEIHRRQTAPHVGERLAELADSALAADPRSDAGTVIRELQRQYQKKTRLPQSLVEELSRAATLGEQAWVEARKADNFAAFQPHLARMLELKRQEAAALGYSATPYDALLDDYEPHATTSAVATVLAELRDALTPLVREIVDSGRRPDVTVLRGDFPVIAQESFGKEISATIGFDYRAGTLDTTTHPFCGGAGPGDVRLTTRYNPADFADGFFSILHEAGHGMYEQGLPREHFGLPTGEAVSLGIHESQSRMWENQVGRSRAFWEHALPRAQAAFPGALRDATVDAFYAAINYVQPSLIRVDADEVTYNLHILIRFELELAMIEGDLQAADLPNAWREKYKTYLGIAPPNDADGALQDVHWSAGLFGYFPTYSLGNLYAAQLFEAARRDLGDPNAAFRRGEFTPLLEWLRAAIHRHGQRYTAAQLVERVSGHPLVHDAWITQMRAKYGELYGL
jgi:carboxypeptidase Taq